MAQTVEEHGAHEAGLEVRGGSAAGVSARLDGLLRAVGRLTYDNPILVKEFRTRMRGARAYWMLLAYTLLLAGVLAIMYFLHETSIAQQADSLVGVVNTEATRDLGRNMFYFVFGAQAFMVALITPGITSGTVTIEREQRSYELLVTTPLRPSDVIRGKLAAAVSFVVLLLTASLPLVSLSFLVGGVSPAEIFFSYVVIALAAFVYGSLGIFWSATLRSTAAATVVTYLTVLSLFIVTFVTGVFAVSSGMGSSGSGAAPGMPFQSLNPFWATFRVVQPEYLFSAKMPSWASSAALNLLLGLLVTTAAMGRLEHFDPPRPWWLRLWSTLLWCAFGLCLFGPVLGGFTSGLTGPVNGQMRDLVRELLGGTLLSMLALILLVVPIFNTGDLIVRRGESALGRYLSGLLPHRMFAADLSSGFSLTAAWSLFLLSLVPFAMWAAGKGGLMPWAAVWIPGVILSLAVAAGLAGIGNFLSVTLPSRWAACVLTYLAAVVLTLLPLFLRFIYDGLPVKPRDPQPLWQVLYLVPWEAFVQLGFRTGGFWPDHPPMLFGRGVPMWVVTTGIYLCIAAFCFLFTALRVQQQGRLLQQRMEAQEKRLTEAVGA